MKATNCDRNILQIATVCLRASAFARRDLGKLRVASESSPLTEREVRAALCSCFLDRVLFIYLFIYLLIYLYIV
jgi:hypothetical protein